MDAIAEPTVPATTASGLLVVDDHDLVRLGLLTLVQSHAADTGQSVPVFEARTLAEALDLYRAQRHRIGLVLLDLQLPDAHGMSGLDDFLRAFPGAPVVVLSGVGDPGLMRHAVSRGALAYLPKAGDLQHVIGFIRSRGTFGEHDRACAAALADDPVPASRWHGAQGQRLSLTERQTQVLEWVLAGASNREIALRAHLSEGTVKNHVSALLLLFGVRSRAQLISQLR
ncbi:MAG: response regulator transcription factor [Hydrogenophaga sp.]|uniref:Response regulator transcription factor n=1 Tax=Hydrogenophaga crocea TaxID=2716225 RepID=A0A6G8IKS6_9BURK|nr:MULTISPECIES: response regulator transcription factor [Hydrogenophaga]MBL0943783.1 response regulator transcription factor [Hydrogenophaga sp.]QIM53817.1 response regulator transcription factor [Hydrogenophaga crocea]